MTMSRAARLLLCTIAAFSAVLAAAGVAAAEDDLPDGQLLKTYEPVLVFHPNEQLRPTKVQSFVADSELERFVGSSAQQ
ncbi:MAG TPA: hypothetical protein VGQ15_01935, partial [Gaiellaceae bacterium]|nr:hypothetical protein [Gaiellaceae bacterium]